jgi:excisionase family DNA binding protein
VDLDACVGKQAEQQEPYVVTVNSESVLLTVSEVADVLRTSRKAIYAMIERGQLPGLRRIGRRVLIRRLDLLHWLDHNCASSRKG